MAQNKDMGSASQTLQTRLNYLCDAGYFLQSDLINFRMIAWPSVVQFGLKSYEAELGDTYPGCQRRFMRGFRFRSSLKKSLIKLLIANQSVEFCKVMISHK